MLIRIRNIAFLTVYGLQRHIFPDRKAAWSRSPSGRRSGNTRLLQEDRPPTYTVKVLHLIQRSLSVINYLRSITTVRMIVTSATKICTNIFEEAWQNSTLRKKLLKFIIKFV